MKPQSQGKPRRKCVTTATTEVSTRQGTKANLMTARYIVLRTLGSKYSPARVKITTSEKFLIYL
jgi:hypothetical protein